MAYKRIRHITKQHHKSSYRNASWGIVAVILALCLPSLAVNTKTGQAKASMTKKTQTSSASQPPIKPVIPSADRHQPGKVFLEHADVLNMDQQLSGGEYQILKGNVVFRKDNMFMYCDSAYFYDKTNSLDAFSNVRMEQGDTLFVYGDELNYNGPEEFATLYGSAGRPVRLINRDVKLVTDIFYYDLGQNYGFYDVGGVLTDKQNRLESMRGEYYPNTKDADFYDDVELKSLRQGDTLFMYTDILHYNTNTHIATISAPTRIINRDGRINTASGYYNTNSGVGDLYQRSTVYSNKGNTLTGDTLFYDRAKGFGEGFGNVILTDSARKSSLLGDYGFYDELRDSAFVTGNALAKEYKNNRDTLYLHGDTINAYLVLPDSVRLTNAFHNVRFYRSDLQGICDSLSMADVDSTMRMYYNPVIWSGERQIFGNLIEVHLNDSTADRAHLPDFGMMAELIDEDCFNQLSGDKMTAWMADSTLRRLYVEGSVQTIMFPMEKDSVYNKYAFTETSFMDAYFKNGQVDTVRMWPETTGTITPLYLAAKNSYFLPKFKWLERFKPTSPQSVFLKLEDKEGLLKPVTTANSSSISKEAPWRALLKNRNSALDNDSIPADSEDLMNDSLPILIENEPQKLEIIPADALQIAPDTIPNKETPKQDAPGPREEFVTSGKSEEEAE